MTTVFIYGLRESTSAEVRYVGQASDPVARLGSHVKQSHTLAATNKKRLWIESVLSSGGSVVMDILEECSVLTAVYREQYWIDHYRGLGHRLVNSQKAKISKLAVDSLNRQAKVLLGKGSYKWVLDELVNHIPEIRKACG